MSAPTTCQGCGAPLPPTRGRPRKWCSDRCRSRQGPVRGNKLPRKTPRRNAADVAFHLGNALRSLNEVRTFARDPLTRDCISRLQATLLDARGAVEPLIDHVTLEQIRRRP